MKAHLLYAERDFDLTVELPTGHEDLIGDLGLGPLLSAMGGQDAFLREVAKRVVLTGLTDPAEIRYRQDVLADCLAEPAVIRAMYAVVVGAVADKRGMWGGSWQKPVSILSGARSQLEAFVERLHQLRRIADGSAGRFRSAGLTALVGSLQRDLDDEYLRVVEDHLQRLRFSRGELLSSRLGPDNGGIDYVLRAPHGRRAGLRERLGIGSRSSHSFTIPPRDEAGGDALAELADRGVNLVADAAARSADHITAYFTVLRAELGFYLGCLNLREALAVRNAPMAFPVPLSTRSVEFACSGLRDAALTLRIEGPVIGNDVDTGGRPLVIVTGANSGGKSTFLRSVGQAQLMMQCGMFVVAESYRTGTAEGTFTHFVREEDRKMVHGRLDEELSRMGALVDRLRPGSLMLFNESFAATNEREGSEIARQVVRALLDAGVRIFLVTHMFDLADSFRANQPERTLFLRAERARDFALTAAEPLPTSFGEDIYRRIGGFSGTDT